MRHLQDDLLTSRDKVVISQTREGCFVSVWIAEVACARQPTPPPARLTVCELDPLVGQAWCSSSQSCEHGSGCKPRIRAANPEGACPQRGAPPRPDSLDRILRYRTLPKTQLQSPPLKHTSVPAATRLTLGSTPTRLPHMHQSVRPNSKSVASYSRPQHAQGTDISRTPPALYRAT
jgi:hypothetical protein